MPRRLPTETRRIQIADAALAVIAQQGLGRFTTQAIAAEVGITDGSLFRHFPSKEHIVLAALDRVEARLFAGFPPAASDPIERLEQFYKRRGALLVEEPLIARLAFSEELPHAAGPAGAAQVQGWKDRSVGFVLACLDEAAAQGRLDPAVPRPELALVVVGSLLALARLDDLTVAQRSVDRSWAVLRRLFGGG